MKTRMPPEFVECVIGFYLCTIYVSCTALYDSCFIPSPHIIQNPLFNLVPLISLFCFCSTMNRLYDTLEPTVIDEILLNGCIEEQGPANEAGRIAKKEGLDFGEVESLRLDFKSKFNYNVVHKIILFLSSTSVLQIF